MKLILLHLLLVMSVTVVGEYRMQGYNHAAAPPTLIKLKSNRIRVMGKPGCLDVAG
ncbi:MAG: hypothetical protein Q8859_01620 [Bacteroidota bacterium]|nr:hypothetical protein [Bacteroidota bacterium]